MSRSLYKIGEDMAALEALLVETGGDVSDPRAAEALSKWESELEGDLISKVDGYVCLIAEIESRADARKLESERLLALSRTDTNAAHALRERLRFIFELRNMKPVQTDRFRVSLVKNGGKQPIDLRVGVDELPSWATRTETVVSVDKDAIRARLESGEQLAFASLLERGNRISIK